MDEIKLEAIVQNFISIIPLFKKKLLHDNCKFDKGNLNHSHFQILAVLKKEGQQPISEVAKNRDGEMSDDNKAVHRDVVDFGLMKFNELKTIK